MSADNKVLKLGQWVSQGVINPEQLVFLNGLPDDTANGALTTIDGLLALKEGQPEVFRQACDAVIVNLGGPPFASPNPSGTSPSGAEEKTSTSPPPAYSSDVVQDVESPVELTFICIDVSGSMQSPFESERTRLEAVKQCFYGFRDQTANSENGGRHRLGLLSYSNKINIHTQPTGNFDVFEDVIDCMRCSGSTAIYDAIVSACQHLTPLARQYPAADVRVMVLSDGLNNAGKSTARDALQCLFDLGAVCDGIIVGDRPDPDLLRVVNLAQGQCFQVSSLADAYETLESPGVVSLASRRNGEPKPPFVKRVVPADLSTVSQATTRKGALQSTRKAPTGAAMGTVADAAKASAASAPGSAAQKRIVADLRRLEERALDGVYLRPGGANGLIQYCNIVLRGPAGTPYEGGAFKLLMTFPKDYPFSAPTLEFVTPIYHFAVDTQGRLCLDILKDRWSPALALSDVVETVIRLVASPETEDPECNMSLRSRLSELFRVERQDYEEEARKHTQQSASASVEVLLSQCS